MKEEFAKARARGEVYYDMEGIDLDLELIRTQKYSPPETLKYWFGVQWGQSYLIGRRCLFSLGWPPSSDGITIKMPYGVDVLH